METVTDAKSFLMSLETIPFTRHDAPAEVIEKLNLAMKIFRESPLWYSLDDLPHEIWREIAGYNGYYLVSIFGRVKSFKQGKIIIKRAFSDARGYLRVALHNESKSKNLQVHRLVAFAFLLNPGNKREVNHFYGTSANAIWQIEWCTGSENMLHAVQSGLQKSGADVYNAKLTVHQVKEILTSYIPYDRNFGAKALAKKMNVDCQIIFNVLGGRKYRNVEGERHEARSYIPENVRVMIKQEYKKGVYGSGATSLAKKYGISKKTVFNIIHTEGD